MSENSLKIRGKFINKLATKIEDLNDNFILLSKVDKKIFKKMNNQIGEKINNQRGGDSKAANNVIVAALKKSQEMRAQQEKLATSLSKLQNIQTVITEFGNTFNNIKKIIDSITLGNFNETQINQINELATSDKNTLDAANIIELEELLNTKKYPLYKEFTDDTRVSPDLKDKIKEREFAILFGDNPDVAAAAAAAPAAGAPEWLDNAAVELGLPPVANDAPVVPQ